MINPNEPIEYEDGTPAEIIGVRHSAFLVRTPGVRYHPGYFGDEYFYDKNTGVFLGRDEYPRIRNIEDTNLAVDEWE